MRVTGCGLHTASRPLHRRRPEIIYRSRLHALTSKSIDNVTALQEELREIKRRGYAFEDQEEEVGVSCIGAGIRNDENRLVAGISVLAPSDRMKWGWAERVKETADKISLAIGYLPATQPAENVR